MTFHTKAATDDIYELFNQPLKSSIDDGEDDESDQDEGEETDGDYTSCGESTGTGRLVTASEAGDDETSEVKSVSEWSEFTARKHVPKIDGGEEEDEGDDTRNSRLRGDEDTGASRLTCDERYEDDEEPLRDSVIDTQVDEAETNELVTPTSPEAPRTMFVPIPPEDYVAPTRPYRNASQTSQNRLPFMTPIAEKTESSMGASTRGKEKEYFNSKTPCKENGLHAAMFQSSGDDLMSSPFQEIINEALPRPKIPQPALGRNVKTNKTAAIAAKVQASGGPLAKEIAPKGPIIKDAQCNPVDDYTRNQIFEALQPPLSSYEGFFDHRDECLGKSAELKKFAKAVAKMNKNGSDKTTTNISMPPVLRFPGTDRQYMVKRELGAGAFAPVYLIENVAADVNTAVDEDNPPAAIMGKGKFSHLSRRPLEALKMEDPPTAWEFYIMRQASRRLGVSRAAESIITAYEMHIWKDECYLIEEYRDQGTLLDVVNLARADPLAAFSSPQGMMDELLVMFFAIELFRTVEALHVKSLLHGDLKADNCLLRLDSVSSSSVDAPSTAADTWSPRYRPDGSGGWNKKGIALIDFGRGIDMKAFRPDVAFIADWKTGATDCAEMRECRPWTWQIDYFGLAGVLHSLLFGKYIETVAVAVTVTGNDGDDDGLGGSGGALGPAKTYRLKEGFKRYWQGEIWSAVFDLLLNPGRHAHDEEAGRMPLLRGMRRVREMMERWVEGNCERGGNGGGLQGMVRRLEGAVRERERERRKGR